MDFLVRHSGYTYSDLRQMNIYKFFRLSDRLRKEQEKMAQVAKKK